MKNPEDELKRMLEIEDPILFLGAGFSLGAKTQNNLDFPTGNQLKKDLIINLLKIQENSSDFKDLMSYNLSAVCDYCENEKSSAHLTDYLVEIFKNSHPAEFHKLITLYPWKKIYSTNIDDVVETCYHLSNKSLLIQNFKRKSTIDIKGKTELIKLHGCVNNPSEGLTFSTRNYLDTMLLTQDYRFNSLSLDMHSESIIFVGQDFNEINIDFYLKLYDNSGYQSAKGKLIFINPYPSIVLKSKLKGLKATLIEWDTQQFLEFVEKTQLNANSDFNKMQTKTLGRFGFLRFKNIKDELLPINKYESSLYFGFQPSWKDILEEWDFRNPQVMAQLTDFLTYVDVKKSGIFSLYGKGLSGKSTFLLRIGNELQLQGYDVWQFKGKYFNYFEFFKWIKHNSDIKLWALIIDDASYNYGNVKRLINLIPSGQQLIVVSTSRIPSHIKLRYNFIDTIHKEFYIEPLIDNDYASAIEEKLDNKGYLGTLKNYTYRAERVRHIAQQNDILTVLYDITYGQGFINRLKSDLNPLLKKDDSATDFLMILAIFERLDLPNVPRELIYLLYGKESAKILQNVDNFVRYTNQGDISLRTSFYLTSILKNSQKGKIISLIKNVLIAISPQIDDNPRNQWNQIEASCTKERTLRSKFSLSIDEIKNMLYELKGELGVSYNYWIQLGIAEQITKDFDKALNHFKQAEALNPGSYMVQNSIGRNYLRQANSSAKASEAKRFFSEGEEILLKLINNREEHQVRAFSTHTYLYEKINYLKKFKMKVSNEELRKMFFLLKNLMDKDPDDTMAKHISNVFLSFLRSINRTNIIRLNYHNISLLKNLLQENDMEIDDLLIV